MADWLDNIQINTKAFYKNKDQDKPSPSDGKLQNKNLKRKDFQKDNVLHQFASYNYEMTLSALSEDEIRDASVMRSKRPHDVIAKSSGIGNKNTFSNEFTDPTLKTDFEESKITEAYKFSKEQLEKNLDIFFQTVAITSVATPNERRKFTNATKIEFTLREPYGISLFQKIRAAAANNGYIDHTDAPFLLTIDFQGEYDKPDDINSRGSLQFTPARRQIPIKITRVTMKVDQAGTEYSGVAVPWTEFALVDRFLYTRQSITCKVSDNKPRKLEQLFNSLEQGLADQMLAEERNGQREYPDIYTFTADPYIFKQAEDYADYTNTAKATIISSKEETELPVEPDFKFNLKLKPGANITEYLERNMMNLPLYKGLAENFIANYFSKVVKGVKVPTKKEFEENPEQFAKNFTELVPWFKVITTVYTNRSVVDGITKMHPKQVRFHIQRYDIHALNFLVAGLALPSLWGKFAKKRFDYIFTGDNQDVLELDIDYNYGYFQSKLSNGVFKATDRDVKSKSIGQKIIDIFSRNDSIPYPETLSPYRSYPTRAKSESTGVYGGNDFEATMANQFYDYLTNPDADMYKVDMRILGDPAFLGHDLFTPIADEGWSNFDRSVTVYKSSRALGTSYWDDDTGSFNFDNAEPIVELNFKFPSDIDDKQGTYEGITSQNTAQFNGIYKVTRVESIFDSGVFTQNLRMVRYKNQKVDQGAQNGIFQKGEKSTDENVKPYKSNSRATINGI
jgi:hypothetical protein